MIREILAAACLAAAVAPNMLPAQKPGPATKPTLVVFITIDQMRGDYPDRFKKDLTGGLKRLVDGGAFFWNGFQDHAVTETAPGHSTLTSGRFPVHTGIAANSQGVGTSSAPLLGGATETGASPFRFKGTTLVDWMRAADPAMRFLSVSRKDRGAILPIGRTKGDVYWWSGNAGIFTTSRYYADTLPTWVQRFNKQKAWAAYAGKSWNLLLHPSRYVEPDTIWEESNGEDFVFPHPFPSDTAGVARILANYPVMDSLTLAMAMRGLHEHQLGADPSRTDFLAISLSTTDAVGHKYGPDSREIHDQIARLDRYLGAFLDSLFALRDQERILIALTGDHGVTPLPEVHSGRYPNKNAKRVNLDPLILALRSSLGAAGVKSSAWSFDDGVFSVYDPAAFESAKVNVDSTTQAFAAALRKVPGVMRVDLFSDLAKANLAKDKIARRWLHMFSPGGTTKFAVTLTPYSYWEAITYATHGMPHDSDAQVPVLFWGAGVRAGVSADTVRTVDIAPTLAAILGVKPLEKLDGVVLKKAVRGAK
ncbi:MAG: alkaline phosphatase family protein [Gemmatimonadaceae bacterium]|nr:alkaline phosphatase family protein [Gemmatimonadaceae bacterium]